MKRTPLRRKTPLRRGKKRLPRFSRLGKLKHDIYTAQRRDFLSEHKFCGVRIMDSDGTIAERGHIWSGGMSHRCKRRATQVHHMRGRGKWYLDTRYWFPICASHHAWVTNNGKAAERLGYVERVYEKH
jgi:hypothetical protein